MREFNLILFFIFQSAKIFPDERFSSDSHAVELCSDICIYGPQALDLLNPSVKKIYTRDIYITI